VGCPFSYIAAEQIERMLGEVEWIPAASITCGGGDPVGSVLARARAEQRAAELRLPLVWPDRFPVSSRSALRAASYASEVGAGARFSLAACRLAFCGGFDLDDPEVLAEAAAVADINLEACLAAAGDPSRDTSLYATARGLLAQGVQRLPAVRVGTRFFERDSAPVEAAALLRTRAAYGSPLVG
jgi:2-hydroxychromene-2-carboxylate isomerase